MFGSNRCVILSDIWLVNIGNGSWSGTRTHTVRILSSMTPAFGLSSLKLVGPTGTRPSFLPLKCLYDIRNAIDAYINNYMITITELQFKNLKTYDLIILKCDHCQGEYERTKKQCRYNMQRKGIMYYGKPTYCSKQCQTKSQLTSKKERKCECCGELTYNEKYCSRSCAAIINNKVSKRIRKPPVKCVRCNNDTVYPRKYCAECIQRGYSNVKFGAISIDDRTIEQAIESQKHNKAANRYTNIRCRAQTLHSKKASIEGCEICGYKRHVEICHKKPISSYPLNTLVSEVNKRENIMYLCPNHHWEFDHPLDPPDPDTGMVAYEATVFPIN